MKFRRENLRLYAVTDRAWLGRAESCGADAADARIGAAMDARGCAVDERSGAADEERLEAALARRVELALRGGVTMVQLREKALPEADFEREAREILRLCHAYGVPLLINDNVELAARIGADGVHVGQGDMDARRARALLGAGKIVGVTAKTVEQARAAEAAGADYLGSGAVFGTSTKSDAIPLDHELFEEICRSVTIPVVAIGGITLENIDRLAGRGMSGFAIVSGIFAADDIEGTARALRERAERLCGGSGLPPRPCAGGALAAQMGRSGSDLPPQPCAGGALAAQMGRSGSDLPPRPCDGGALVAQERDCGELSAAAATYCEKVRAKRPVVQCIANIVTAGDCANALLAIGASPTMAHHLEEMEDFAALSDALVLNMGATESLEAMFRAGKCANSLRTAGEKTVGGTPNGVGGGHPIVIDPVGCAGSRFRRAKCLELIEAVHPACIRGNAAEIKALALDVNTGRGVDDVPVQPACIRGNAAEIKALALDVNTGRGVDDVAAPSVDVNPAHYAKLLSKKTGAIVIASGAVDYLAQGDRVIELHGGTPMLARITGTGCMLSSMLGAFLSVEESIESAAACCELMAACGERAEAWAREDACRCKAPRGVSVGTGTFRLRLFDALSTAD